MYYQYEWLREALAQLDSEIGESTALLTAFAVGVVVLPFTRMIFRLVTTSFSRDRLGKGSNVYEEKELSWSDDVCDSTGTTSDESNLELHQHEVPNDDMSDSAATSETRLDEFATREMFDRLTDVRDEFLNAFENISQLKSQLSIHQALVAQAQTDLICLENQLTSLEHEIATESIDRESISRLGDHRKQLLETLRLSRMERPVRRDTSRHTWIKVTLPVPTTIKIDHQMIKHWDRDAFFDIDTDECVQQAEVAMFVHKKSSSSR